MRHIMLTALLTLALGWTARAQTVDWTTEAGRGRGASPALRAGYNNDVDTAAAETVWPAGGTYGWLSSTSTLYASSTDSGDASASLTITGLDTDWNIRRVSIQLDESDPSATAAQVTATGNDLAGGEGAFASTPTLWTYSGFAWSAGTMAFNGSTACSLSKSVALPEGGRYQLTFTASNYSTRSVAVALGDHALTTITGNGTTTMWLDESIHGTLDLTFSSPLTVADDATITLDDIFLYDKSDQDFIRVLDVEVDNVSSLSGNVYVATDDDLTGGVPDSGVLAMLPAGSATTRQAVYSSALGYDYMVMGWGGSASGATTWTLRVKEYGGPWRVVRALSAEGTEPAPWYERLAVPVRVPAKGDVEIRAEVSANDTMVFGNLDGLLIDRP